MYRGTASRLGRREETSLPLFEHANHPQEVGRHVVVVHFDPAFQHDLGAGGRGESRLDVRVRRDDVRRSRARYDCYQRSVSVLHPRGYRERRLLGRESLVPDRSAKLGDRHPGLRCEPDANPAFVQTDLRAFDAVELLYGHAHGVGAYASVHAENRLVDRAQLSLGRAREQGHGGECG